MFFFGLPAILVAVYGWNFRILQTINTYQKSTNKESLYEISLKLDEKFSRLCFSSSCITPVSLALYVRCKCLGSSHCLPPPEKIHLLTSYNSFPHINIIYTSPLKDEYRFFILSYLICLVRYFGSSYVSVTVTLVLEQSYACSYKHVFWHTWESYVARETIKTTE